MNSYELLTCSHCLSKAFSQHYSMTTATWLVWAHAIIFLSMNSSSKIPSFSLCTIHHRSKSGLRSIPNSLCCEEHFHWWVIWLTKKDLMYSVLHPWWLCFRHRINCPSSVAEEHLVTIDILREQKGSNGILSEFFFWSVFVYSPCCAFVVERTIMVVHVY